MMRPRRAVDQIDSPRAEDPSQGVHPMTRFSRSGGWGIVLLTLLLPGWFPLGAAEPARLAIRFGRLIDGAGNVRRDALVLVARDRIQSVGSFADGAPQDATLVDLSRYTGLPGLNDAHTHMTYAWDPTVPGNPFKQGERHPAITVFLAQENARRCLQAGVTTVRDLGADDYNDIALRDLINRGAIAGPRM